jgi:hypothetical protein
MDVYRGEGPAMLFSNCFKRRGCTLWHRVALRCVGQSSINGTILARSGDMP